MNKIIGHKNSFEGYKYAPYIPIMKFTLPIKFIGYDKNGKAKFKKINQDKDE